MTVKIIKLHNSLKAYKRTPISVKDIKIYNSFLCNKSAVYASVCICD